MTIGRLNAVDAAASSDADDRVAPKRGRKLMRRIIGYGVLVVLVSVAALFLRARSFDNGPTPPSLEIIGRLPVTLADGRHVRMGDTLKVGVPTVITLWASWCGPCRSEAPKVAELRRRFGTDALNIVYLNVRDSAASHEDLARYMTDFGMASTDYAVMDDSNIAKLTNAKDTLIPRTLVFDAAGKPLATITGYKPLALARVAGLVG